jgi:GT2 family glycosyltransferase
MVTAFDTTGNIGIAYNDVMQNSSFEWVGFKDDDVMFLNHNWYAMFLRAIEVVGENAGMITCFTNRIGCPLQKAPDVDRHINDIAYHKRVAEELLEEHGPAATDVTNSQFNPSGMCFVTSKKAWYDVGGFKKTGLLGVDTTYGGRLKEKGYKVYLLKGLYVYHWYRYQI